MTLQGTSDVAGEAAVMRPIELLPKLVNQMAPRVPGATSAGWPIPVPL